MTNIYCPKGHKLDVECRSLRSWGGYQEIFTWCSICDRQYFERDCTENPEEKLFKDEFFQYQKDLEHCSKCGKMYENETVASECCGITVIKRIKVKECEHISENKKE